MIFKFSLTLLLFSSLLLTTCATGSENTTNNNAVNKSITRSGSGCSFTASDIIGKNWVASHVFANDRHGRFQLDFTEDGFYQFKVVFYGEEGDTQIDMPRLSEVGSYTLDDCNLNLMTKSFFNHEKEIYPDCSVKSPTRGAEYCRHNQQLSIALNKTEGGSPVLIVDGINVSGDGPASLEFYDNIGVVQGNSLGASRCFDSRLLGEWVMTDSGGETRIGISINENATLSFFMTMKAAGVDKDTVARGIISCLSDNILEFMPLSHLENDWQPCEGSNLWHCVTRSPRYAITRSESETLILTYNDDGEYKRTYYKQ